MRILVITGMFAAGSFAGAAAGSATAPEGTVFLRTPSKNIACAYDSGLRFMRCDVLSGLKPRPPKPRTCKFDWATGYQMNRVGRARIVCASDSVYSNSARVLRYGSTWRRGGFTCTSKVTGLRCTNASGHGFSLSKERSYRF